MENKYMPFYVQKENEYLNDGTTANDTTVHDSDEWNIRITDYPFISQDTKDLPENDWHDEHGKEVYIPDELPIKAYEVQVSFVYKGSKATAGAQIMSFLDYLRKGGYFKFYCEWAKMGAYHVRYVSCDTTKAYLYKGDNDGDVVTFKVKLAVDAPDKSVTLDYDSSKVAYLKVS